MAGLLIAAALASAPLPTSAAAAPPLPDASPAMWVVNDRDTVIYLFGTFHALDGTTDWFNDEVATAFDASQELVLETIIPRPGHPQRPVPSIEKRVRGLGAAPSASSLGATRIAAPAEQPQGMQLEKGADEVLRRAAEADGKIIRGLESFQAQLDMFARLPAPQRKAPGAKARPDGEIGMPTVLGWMQTAWNKGDQRIFTNVIEQMRKTSPTTYEMMFSRRNATWANWIANRLEQPGTIFVAVGAGHLAGIDSVQAKLAELGVKSERIN